MLLYHIADIHLGKSINGISLIEDQRFWINKFLEKCDAGHPDAVLIAGDVYDRVNPTGDAFELLSFLLSELDSREIAVFMISGNHDSGQKVAFGQSILAKRNIHIAGKVQKEIAHYTMDDPDGVGPVTFWLLPYVFPEAVSTVLEDANIKSYDDAVKALIAAQNIDASHRNVLLAHQNVVANGQEVERGGSESMVGGLGPIEYTAFDAFDYVALGHIHSGVKVGRSSVRYAGTPLCYHFDETKYADKKGIVEVVLGKKGDEIKPSVIKIEPLHKMHLITGTRSEIEEKVKNEVGEGEYVGLTMTDQRFTSEISEYLRSIIVGRNGLLLENISTFKNFVNSGAKATAGKVREAPIENLFSDFYKSQMGDKDPSADELAFLQFLGELVRNNQESSIDDDLKKVCTKLGIEEDEE